MSNTVIQIKRSETTSIPAALQPGELAYTGNGEVLYIGSVIGSNTANVVAIAGKRVPGTLTANQALVANSSSWIDAIQTSKLIVGNTAETINVTSIVTTGNSTSVGTASNSELATTYAIKKFVDEKTAAISSSVGDTQVVFSNSGTFTGNSAFTFNDDTLTVNISNTLAVGVNLKVSNNTVDIGNSTVNSVLTSTGLSFKDGLGDFVSISSTAVSLSNNVVANTSALRVGNVFTNSTGISVQDIVTVGTEVTINTTAVKVGNATSYVSLTNAGEVVTTGLANLNSANVVGNLNVGGTLRAGNTIITGDLTVTGNVTTVDTTNLVIEDSLIRLAKNQANSATFTDAVDIGFYGVYGNTSNVLFTGLARESGTDNYVLFTNSNTAPDNDGVDTSDTLATLYAYLNSGGLTTNSTAVSLIANSTVNVSIVANSLSLSTVLAVNSGGTGVNSLTNNAILVGNNSGPLTLLSSATEGHVLQIASGVPAFGMLDGGTF